MIEREPTTIGSFAAADRRAPAITGVSLELRALELVAHWKRCGLTADWLAGFFAYDFERDVRIAAETVLTTAINELIENAAKFCADKQAGVTISVHHHGDFMRIETRNRADDARIMKLRAAIDALDGDLDALFAERIAHQAEPGASGIGLVILKKDYAARVGARIAPTGPRLWEAHVQVTIDTEQIGGGT